MTRQLVAEEIAEAFRPVETWQFAAPVERTLDLNLLMLDTLVTLMHWGWAVSVTRARGRWTVQVAKTVGDQDLTRRWTRNREALRLPVVFVWRRGKEADVVWFPESFRRPAHDELEWLERCERVLKEGQRYLIEFEGASGGQEGEWWFIRLGEMTQFASFAPSPGGRKASGGSFGCRSWRRSDSRSGLSPRRPPARRCRLLPDGYPMREGEPHARASPHEDPGTP